MHKLEHKRNSNYRFILTMRNVNFKTTKSVGCLGPGFILTMRNVNDLTDEAFAGNVTVLY